MQMSDDGLLQGGGNDIKYLLGIYDGGADLVGNVDKALGTRRLSMHVQQWVGV